MEWIENNGREKKGKERRESEVTDGIGERSEVGIFFILYFFISGFVFLNLSLCSCCSCSRHT